MKTTVLTIACVVLATEIWAIAPKAESGLREQHWLSEGKEPVMPFLAQPSEAGFHGRVARLERIDPDNAVGEELRTWKGLAWRNERVHAQFVVWSAEPTGTLVLQTSDLRSETGDVIPAAAISARFVRNVIAEPCAKAKLADHGARAYGDVLDGDLDPYLPRNGYRAVWLTVRTPASARAGTYRGSFAVRGTVGVSVKFAIELEIVDRALPDPKDWKFYLNIWQHPTEVARYHRVKPYSAEHYRLLVPYLKELAASGQKVIYAYCAETPFRVDGRYCAQVVHVRKPDGTFVRDYSRFDEYVALARRAGLGPFLECSTIIRKKNNRIVYVDETTGGVVRKPCVAGSPESDAFWGDFLVDFEKHLREKGWFENAYIDLDELDLDDLKTSLTLMRRRAPGFKTAFACDKPPEAFLALRPEHYTQGLRKPEKMFPPAFWEALKERQKDPNLVTTFYVCNLPGSPNTWVRNDYDECAWQGLFAAARGFSGFQRWAAFKWTHDPLWDASCPPRYDAGESFLFYPGPRLSTRWEVLRDSFENFEKIRILREIGGMTPALETALAAMTPECVGQYEGEKGFAAGRARARAQVEPVLRELDEASRARGTR